MRQTPNRRRFIGLSAAAAGFALLPFGGGARAMPGRIAWRGAALGAPAEMVLHHPDRAAAERLIARSIAEIARLERIFSLYREDSALSELNRVGALAAPPPELVEVLDLSRDAWTLSGGAFDPTIQPLWRLYARHFAAAGADPAGPAGQDVTAALGLVGLDGVVFSRERIVFARRGMALTLNGIAQGFITDRIVAMLRAGGITSTLADLGEIRALGTRADGTPWRVGIAGGQDAIDLVDRAVATSSDAGFRFAGPDSPGHLLDPANGRSAGRYASVSVLAAKAATADALSTACSFMTPQAIGAMLAVRPDLAVRLILPDGRRLAFGHG